MRSFLIVALLAIGTSFARAEVPLSEGLGEGPDARMRMKFEVTFMKIDVADVEAWLSPETARALDGVREMEDEGDARDRVQEVVLASRSMLITMHYLRDAGHGRLMKGIRGGFEAAMKSGLVAEVDMERTYGELAPTFDVLEERGVLEGDRLVYRVDGDRLRVLYVDPGGDALVEGEYTGTAWAIGMKGAFFGEKSRFRKKLVRSYFETPAG